MKKIIVKTFRFIFSFLGPNQKRKIVSKLATALEVNLLGLAYKNIGISIVGSLEESGEHYVLEKVVKEKLPNKTNFVFFDVGANIGSYSIMLHNIFPNASIYAFEPNAVTYKVLLENVNSHQNINPVNIGLSSAAEKAELFSYETDTVTGHATLYNAVLKDVHRRDDILSQNIDLITLYEFCRQENIYAIDFLKIDTEGHELSVLQGAKEMTENGKISIIQFEFNEMNVISRVFLKDFFELLPSYKFYRINADKLVPLFPYSPRHEIFRFQNLLAIHNNYLIPIS